MAPAMPQNAAMARLRSDMLRICPSSVPRPPPRLPMAALRQSGTRSVVSDQQLQPAHDMSLTVNIIQSDLNEISPPNESAIWRAERQSSANIPFRVSSGNDV